METFYALMGALCANPGCFGPLRPVLRIQYASTNHFKFQSPRSELRNVEEDFLFGDICHYPIISNVVKMEKCI